MDEILKSARNILGTIAPTVATALGGPLAGVAVRALAEALDLSPDTSQEQVLQQISEANPETLLKLKEAENNFKVQMKQLEVDIFKLEALDKDSARNREISTGDKTTRILAFLIVGLYICMQIWLVSGNVIPGEMREVVMRALGTLDAIMGMIFSYYYGSSLGSKEKTNQIESLIHARPN